MRLLGSASPAPPTFTTWKVQGNHGGEAGFPDRVRGSLNEGGLYGERHGWHLPGFDDARWNVSAEGAPAALNGPGVRFFRASLALDDENLLADDHDAGLSFSFGRLGGFHRALLFVNGWQMGKFAASVGPQVRVLLLPGRSHFTRALTDFVRPPRIAHSPRRSSSPSTRASSSRAQTRSRSPSGRTTPPTRRPSTCSLPSTGSCAAASAGCGPTAPAGSRARERTHAGGRASELRGT